NRQRQTDGSWVSNAWLGDRPYASAWAIIILTSTLFQQGPVAVINARPNPGAVGQAISFDATGSFHQDPFFQIVQYRWDFDDSDGIDFDTPDATGPAVTHTFGQLKTFRVTLQVEDNNTPPLFDTGTVEIRITIPPHPPTADAGGPYVAAVGEAIQFDGSGSFDIDQGDGDSIQSYQWEVDFQQPLDFDDGVTGVKPVFLTGFTTPGLKTVGLRVKDRTATVFPQAGQPDLTDDDFAEVLVYQKVIDDLAARPKDQKIQLTWTPKGGQHFQIWRSELGPNHGFTKIAVTHSTYSTYLDQGIQLNVRYFYRIVVYHHNENHSEVDPVGSSCTVAVTSSPRSRDLNLRPRITTSPVLQAVAGEPYTYDVNATDGNGDPITFALLQGPEGMVMDAGTGVVSFTPREDQVGVHTVFLAARDNRGGEDTQIYELLVKPSVNTPPVADANGPYVALRGQPVSFSSAGTSDPDGDALTYTWSFGDGQTSNDENPIHVYTAAGNFVATLIVNDGRGGTASDQATVQIDEPNREPTALVRDGPDFVVRLGEVLTLDGSPSSDPDGDPLEHAWSWGDSTPGDMGVQASHEYAAEGTYLGSLMVKDGRGGESTYEFTVEVGPPNQVPLASFILTEIGQNVGDQFTFDGSASQDPDGDPITHSWDFGDGQATTGIVVTHVFGAPGDFTVTLRVRDNHSGEGTASAVVHINAPPVFASTPPTSANEDELYTYGPQVTDADGDAITLLLVQGPAGMGFDGAMVSWRPGQGDVGQHAVLLRASDPNGASAEQAFTLTVVDVNDPPAITTSPPLLAEEERLYAYDVDATDIDDAALVFDLVQAPAGMSIDGSSGLIQWTPANADVGSHGVTVRVRDPRGGEDTQGFTLVVTDVNDPPVITSSPPLVATENSPYAYDVDATDEDDAVVTFSLALFPAGMVIDPTSGLIEWTPDVGGITAQVRVVAMDPRGGSASQSFGIAVANVNDAPVITSSPPLQAVAERLYRYQVAASDEDGDALSYALVAGPAGMAIDAAGLVQWTPAMADVGMHPVTVRVVDVHGADAAQSYTLEVLERNRPPEITSAPVTTASEDAPYSYDVEATDPDSNPLVFSLTASPAGMTIDAMTGVISWTPALADVGDHTVTVRVDDGLDESDVQTYTLTVLAVNDPPEIVSAPVTQADVGFPYAYDVNAVDEEGDPLTFSLAQAPSGMTIDGSSGLIQWTPDAGQLGDHAVRVVVTDLPGSVAAQDFTVTVVDATHPPVVGAIPNQVVQDPNPFSPIALDGFVSDPDHPDSAIVWNASGPTELVVTITDRVATVTYAPGTRVTEQITFTATDPDGLQDSTTASFTVAEPSDDRVPPVLVIELGFEALALGDSATVRIRTQDNEGIGNVMVKLDGELIPASDLGGGVFESTVRGDSLGTHRIEVVALDLAGNQFMDFADFLVVDPTITTSLTVAIASPAEDSLISSPAGIVGTASGDNFAGYVVELAAQGTNGFVELGSGAAPVTGGTLATLDPGTVDNGVYTIRLTARNLGGMEASASTTVEVDSGRLKVGPFTLTFDDKSLRFGNTNLELARIYDSRNKMVGDFGFGWKASIHGAELVENRSPAIAWKQERSGGFFPVYSLSATKPHTATIQFGAEEKRQFVALPNPSSQVLFPIDFLDSMNYVGGATAKGTLVAGESPFFVVGGIGEVTILDSDFEPYNPGSFFYTDEEDYQFTFTEVTPGSLRHRLTRIVDPNGNTTTFATNGILRSDGKSIGFTRDAQGRIASITDPNGSVIRYEYNIRGDLAVVIDEVGSRTEFTYDRMHNLLEIRDPLGNRAYRTEYDEQGRVIATVDAKGNRFEYTHDVAGNEEILRDPRGNLTRYVYDGRGNVTLVEQPAVVDGALVLVRRSFTYDAQGNLISETDPDGITKTFQYDADGNITRQTVDPAGLNLVTTRTYAGAGRPLVTTDPNGNVTRNTYDAEGRLLSTEDAEGGVTTNTYNAQGLLVKITDAMGNETRFTHHAVGLVLSKEVADGGGNRMSFKEFAHDANGNVVRETEHRTIAGELKQLVTAHTYDAKNRRTSTTDALGGVTRYEYNAAGLETARIDPLGRRTTFEYEERGLRTSVVHPDGTSDQTEYDARGNVVRSVDRSGNATTYEYDELNRVTATHLADGSVVTEVYTAGGRVKAEIDGNGNRTDYEYDAAGRRVRTIHPPVFDPSSSDMVRPVTVVEYDGASNATALTNPLGRRTESEYDGLRRKVRTIYPDGTSLASVYDALFREVERTDPSGATTLYQYDGASNLLSVTLPPPAAGEASPVTTYEYDEAGNLVGQTDALGRVTLSLFDELGRPTLRTLPGGQSENFAYDEAGRLAEHVDYNGFRTTFEYDAADRVTRRTYQDGTSVSLEYTGTGKVSAATDSRGTTRYAYDGRDRLLSVTHPNGSVVGYTYDGNGNRLSVSSPAGLVTYEYDALNRLTKVTGPEGATEYAYDLAGNRVSTTAPNGPLTEYTYDSLNRLTRLVHKTSSGAVLGSFDYDLSPTGMRTNVTELGGTTVTYTYDGLNRLTREVRAGADPYDTSYEYDAVGNRVHMERDGTPVHYTYDANDRLLTENGTTYSYDGAGNLIQRDDGATVTTFTYDYQDRMVRVSDGTSLTDYAYDAAGNRVARISGSETVTYLVDTASNTGHTQVIEERDGLGALRAFYTYGDDLLSMNRGGAASFYHYDGLGSTRLLTDASETVTDTYTYDSYGLLLATMGSTENPYLYTGEQFDPNSGFYYLRARYYDPSTGRFTSPDPFFGFTQDPVTLHKYLYAGGNPANFIDPSGLVFGGLAGISISTAIHAGLQAMSIGIRVCYYIGIAETVQAFAAIAPLAMLPVLLSIEGLRVGFIFVIADLPPKNRLGLKKFDVRIWLQGGEKIFTIAVDTTLDEKIRVNINITSPEKSNISGGKNIKLFEKKFCGLEILKLEVTWRVSVTAQGKLGFGAGIEATILKFGKLFWPILRCRTGEGCSLFGNGLFDNG
ncbi:MAG: PKD domain-containing protein, partial [Planctomycetes bacterium]|nr:PKD domain-containing protein [Planctomycetota bacterium]